MMKRNSTYLLLFLSLVHFGFGAIDIQTASVSALAPNEGDVLLEYVDDFSSGDLINEGSPSLLDWNSTAAFGSGGVGNSFVAEYMNDGIYEGGDKKNTYFDPGRLPAVVTYNLDTSVVMDGYNLTSISTFMGWGFESRVHVHQDYKIEISLVGSADYVLLTDVLYTPFTDLTDFEGNYESKVRVVEDVTGILASGVDSIRFTFNDTGGPAGGGGALGTVIREIDVVGFAVGGNPNELVIATPSERQIVQRNSSNVADIPIGGTFVSNPDFVEARAVVKSGGENNGTTTSWQTVEAVPTGGTFSGVLSNVPAGGWYELEVRSVVGGTPSSPVTVGRVGVGDVFICSGQSNSANQGTPALTPSSDRVSARDSVDDNSWIAAVDPIPIAEGSMGSPWTRLGDLIVAGEDVPVGFISLGRNNSTVAAWSPDSSNNNNLLNPAIKSFPQDGFRGVLWHQGEADSAISTSAASYRDTLIGIINHGRGSNGANWDIPWYVSEASYQPSDPLTVEEGILAGQRKVAFDVTNVYLGADTNDFHLEGRSSDGVHFNAAGLAEHAQQWFEVIYQRVPAEARNGDFELNTNVSLTGVSPLAENAFAETISSAINGPAVLDWRILGVSGDASADGSNGFFNPGSETYSKEPLAKMSGPHAATMRGGSGNNYFLQTLRALVKPNKTYFLSAAFGKRDVGAETYAGARLELMNGSSVLASLSVDSNKLNTLAGGNATGKFTDATLRYDTGALAGQPHELGIRILKVAGGVNTYLDFDNVVLTEVNTSSAFVSWLDSFSLVADPNQDLDGDGITNLVEYAIGTSPLVVDNVSILGNMVGEAIRVTRRQGSVGGLAYTIESSTDLSVNSWTALGGVVENVVSTDGDFETVDFTRDGGWFPGAEDELYYRLKVEIVD